MPDAATFMAFLAAVLAMQAVPGPDTMLVVSRGVGQGRVVAVEPRSAPSRPGSSSCRCSPPASLRSCALRRSPSISCATPARLSSSGSGLGCCCGAGALSRRRRRARPRARLSPRAWCRNLINPNVLVFMLAFLPQFVDPTRGAVMGQMLLFGAVQKLTGLVVLGGTALAAGSVGDLIARRPGLVAWQERFAGAVMLALALRLVVAGDARGKA